MQAGGAGPAGEQRPSASRPQRRPAWVVAVRAPNSNRSREQTDLLLVLAMDVSRSMDQAKFLLQRQGYAAAISNPQVLNAIQSGPHQKIALCFIDWPGPLEQKLVIDWTIIDGPAAASRFGPSPTIVQRQHLDWCRHQSRQLSSPDRRSRPNAEPLMCRAMVLTMLVLTSNFSAIRLLPKASLSTAL
jgi:hypothetical protein